MKIIYHFESLKNFNDVSYGYRFLDLLSKNELIIDKVSDCEPINNEYLINEFPEMWNAKGHTGMFLFKGHKANDKSIFKGMVCWNINLQPDSKSINSIDLSLNLKKGMNIDMLLKLGDDIFSWSEPVYGYITEETNDPQYGVFNQTERKKCKYPDYILRRGGREKITSKGSIYVSRGNIYDGIPDLMWINYFGKSYVENNDFHLLENSIVLKDGVRLQLTEMLNDLRLAEPDFLESKKISVGLKWFWQNPKICDVKVPSFDRSEITIR